MIEQDYVLFLTLLSWAGAAVLWGRYMRRETAWDWLPWSAGAGLVAAVLELSAFNNPVAPSRFEPTHLVLDRVHGIVLAVMLAGWFLSGDSGWARVGRKLRIAVAVGLVGTAAARWLDPNPALGGWALALTAVVGWVVRRGWTRGCAVIAIWASWIGPVAELLSRPRRWSEASEWSLLWSSAQLGAAVAALVVLLWQHRRLAAGADERREWRPLLIACGVWLVAGLGLSAWVVRQARSSFETAMVSRAATAAALMDRDIVAAALGRNFRISGLYQRARPDGNITRHAHAEIMAEPAGVKLRRELGRIEQANPDPKYTYISTLREGWVVDITSDRQQRASPTGVGLSSRVEPLLQQAWERKTAEYFTPYRAFRGLITAARAPLLDRDGRMLGWITFELSTAAWSSSQSQARLLVFVIIAFGFVLAVLVMVQRRRFRERENARASASVSAMADQMKTVFLAKVSHELRTPIQSILGYSELLADDVKEGKGQARLAALRQHGQLMLRLVNDLLDLTALQTGSFRLNERPTSCVDVVGQTVESLRPRAEAKQLEFQCEIDPSVPPWVRIDGERIRQLTFNLVGNAIKFTDAGRVKVILAPGPAPHELRLQVTDTGPGIPEDERARLFHPFARLEATANKEGTGLGLSLAAALCRSMQGTITVDSSAGGGASFSATFRAPACSPLSLPEGAHLDGLQGRRILVAEDNTLVRELFTAFLEDRGATCVAVADGEAAVAAARQGQFNAIVLDLNLPLLDGFDVAKRLRASASFDLRIVGVSAHAGEAARVSALAAGMNAFLTKPVELSALARALNPTGQEIADQKAEALQERLTAQFRSEAAEQAARLATAMKSLDAGAIRAAAHYVMNSAAVVRDQALFIACRALEQAAQTSDERSLQESWRECEAALRPWLETSLSSGGGSSDSKTSKPSPS